MGKQKKLQVDDDAVFVPAEDIRIIERVLNNWEQVKQEYCKVEAGRKVSDNEELKKDNIIRQ